MRERDIIRLFPQKIRAALEHAEFDMEHLYEIRLRVNAPLILIYKGNEYFLTKEGKLTKQMQGVCQVEAKDLRETMEYVSNYSMYAPFREATVWELPVKRYWTEQRSKA